MLKKSFILSILSLIVSLISVGNQLLIAYSFGSSSELDEYLTVSGIPLFVSGTIVAAFSYSLTPFLLEQEKSRAFNQDRSSTSMTIVVFAIIATLFVLAISLPFYKLDFKNGSQQTLFWTTLLLSYFCCVLNIVGGYLNSVAASSFKFNLPFLASGLPPVFVVFTCFGLSKVIGPPAIILGLVIGNIFAISIVSYYIGKEKLFPVTPINFISASALGYFKRLPLILVGMLGFTVFTAIDIIWTQKLGESKLAYLSYCQRIVVSIGTLIIAGPSSILTPYLAKQLQEDAIQMFYITMERSLRLVLVISAFVSVNLFIYAQPITQLLFQRGNFSQNDTKEVASILPYFGFGMTLMVMVVIMFRAIMVKKDLKAGAQIGLVGSVSYFILSGIFSKLFDFHGISYAYILTWLLALAVTVKLLWRQNLTLLLNQRSFKFLFKVGSAIIILIFPLQLLNTYFFLNDNLDSLHLILNLSQVSIVAFILYISLLLLFKIEEADIIKTIKF
jgi:putative peptidoglycan lipid II flippase